jgi:hypothetical protein
MVSVKDLEPKYEMAWKYLQGLGIPLGDYLEFGVSYGTSMLCMHRVLNRLGIKKVRMIGFDSFRGLPQSAATEDLGVWKPGQFACSVQHTYEYLTKHHVDWSRTLLVRGWFENTLCQKTVKTYKLRKASVIMIDCDLYSSSRAALNFCLPMIKDYAIVFVDHWRGDMSVGESRAYSEFLKENSHLVSKELGTYFPKGKIFLIQNTKTSPHADRAHSIVLVPLFFKIFWHFCLY